MRQRLFSPLLVCSLLVLPVVSCSKKSDETVVSTKTGVTQLFQEPLLKKLPPATAGVSVIDFAGQGFQKMKSLPITKSSSFINQINSMADKLRSTAGSEETVKLLDGMLATFRELGVVGTDGTANWDTLVSKAVLFVAPDAQSAEGIPALGGFFAAAPGASLKQKLPVLKKALEQNGGAATPITIAGAEGFQVGKALVVASDNLMAVTSSKGAAERLFTTEETSAMAELLESPELKQLQGKLQTQDPAVHAVFISMSKLTPIVEKLAAAAGEDTSKLQLKDLPIDGLSSLATVRNDQLINTMGLGLTGRTEAQKKVLTALGSANLPSIAGKFPADSAFSVSLDLKPLATADQMWTEMSANGTPQAQIELLKSIKGVSLAVRGNDAGSPIPDVFLALDSSKRDEIATNIEQLVGQGMGGGQAIPWQEKKVGDTSTRYFMTPLGAGIFMARPNTNADTLIAASSERALKDELSVSTGASKGMNAVIKTGDYRAGKPGELFSMYVNFINTAAMLEGVKSSMAMFTGGSKEFEDLFNTTALRTMGNGFLSVGYSEGVLGIDSISSSSGQ
jgi:hypothetical protein